MLQTAGLSLEQAPPIHLPLRLFLTAPWFVVTAGLVLIVHGEAIFASRWTPAALAVTHLLTIGFLAQVMCGALIQALPVITGAPLPAVSRTGPLTHGLLTLGAGLLAWGFLGGSPLVLGLGAGASALGLLIFLAAAAGALLRAPGAPATRIALWLALASLAVTLLLGLAMTGALLGWLQLPRFADWVAVHLSWGLLGWVGLVIVGVAFQMVPLFHVTPEYPRSMVRLLTPSLFASLAVASLLFAAGRHDPASWAMGLNGLGFGTFALVTLDRQRRRSRPRLDVTLWHWRAAMASILAVLAAWLLQAPGPLIGVLLLVGVGVGLPSGMLFKIVPFLCWFHLQARQVESGRFDVRVPLMHKLLAERPTRWHFRLHLLAQSLLVASVLWPVMAPAAGVALAAAALWLFVLLATAATRFALAAEKMAERTTR